MKSIFFNLLLCLTVASGCSHQAEPAPKGIELRPTVKVIHPEVRTIRRLVAQPGVIEPYEQTAIYSKVAGFVQKWKVDIGSHVKKDELLAELLVPELDEELQQKVANVEHAKAMADQAGTLVEVAESNLKASSDAVVEAKANVNQYEAAVKYWQGQVGRLKQVSTAVNPEVLPETEQTVAEKKAELDAALASVQTRQSQQLAAGAQVSKSKADLAAAQAQVKVAEADQRRTAALFAYTKITAPYDGVITVRNVNTGDFVRPANGDSSGGQDGGSSAGSLVPLFIIDRTNPMMFVVGVPEVDAPYVVKGSKASLRLQSLAEREYNAEVTRTSLALRNQSRTLQAEIDLPNPSDELLAGMYAYGSIQIERPDVHAIPLTAITEIGNRDCCYLVVDGKAVRTQIQAGVNDGTWSEVVKRRSYPTSGDPGAWENFTGGEQVVASDLSEVSDGKEVKIDGGS